MKSLILCSLALVALAGCAASSSDACFCDYETEKYDGEQCVASADFTAPACTAEEASVCGCDDNNYTSTCAAYTAGVEVRYAGACRASFGGNGGSGGGGFGW
jgi:hypothetical protein